ncbi:hypothetical protein KGM_205684 [Danaus plexippus plexippus]|uniref:Uncharacterized protein n=1 Tax=Danaus plexippus plexippus TaxID=278856 RepID=A0A212FLF3_DANPL|nr:hypothetical protein KGM_205684 [Danaus plexippus plexippus]
MCQAHGEQTWAVDNIHVTMRNIRGSASYWRKCCSELIAMRTYKFIRTPALAIRTALINPVDLVFLGHLVIILAKRQGGTVWYQLYTVALAILSLSLASGPECAYRRQTVLLLSIANVKPEEFQHAEQIIQQAQGQASALNGARQTLATDNEGTMCR